mgnify:CR=1 FL=1
MESPDKTGDDRPEADSSDPGTTEPAATLHRYVACEACGKRMLLAIEEGTHEHRCPVCGLRFLTTRQHGQVSVRFDEAPR